MEAMLVGGGAARLPALQGGARQTPTVHDVDRHRDFFPCCPWRTPSGQPPWWRRSAMPQPADASQSEGLCPGCSLGPAGPRHLLHGAQMRCGV